MTRTFAGTEELVEEARRIGKHRTRQAAVKAALEEYVNGLRRQRIFELFGTVEYDPSYDYKSSRHRRAG